MQMILYIMLCNDRSLLWPRPNSGDILLERIQGLVGHSQATSTAMWASETSPAYMANWIIIPVGNGNVWNLLGKHGNKAMNTPCRAVKTVLAPSCTYCVDRLTDLGSAMSSQGCHKLSCFIAIYIDIWYCICEKIFTVFTKMWESLVSARSLATRRTSAVPRTVSGLRKRWPPLWKTH